MWVPARVSDYIAWCERHLALGGRITDYHPRPYDTLGMAISIAPIQVDGVAVPAGTICPARDPRASYVADPATSMTYWPDGTVHLPPGRCVEPWVPVCSDLAFGRLPGYWDYLDERHAMTPGRRYREAKIAADGFGDRVETWLRRHAP